METLTKTLQARLYLLSGHVQGVGFRPFVYRLANKFGIHGWVENWVGQVAIHAEGPPEYLHEFEIQLITQAPPQSHPVLSQTKIVKTEHYNTFSIHPSDANKPRAIHITPDLPLCDVCLDELNDPANRRYHYPFTNCAECGPRYTIIRQLPYDRTNTTMNEFQLCHQCQREYDDPEDHRFHAEAIACPTCGPGISFSMAPKFFSNSDTALTRCVQALEQGNIVAVKGIGGYHLMCDASNDDAVMRLRQHKPRPDKPLAVMMLTQHVHQHVTATEDDMELLNGPTHPILLLPKKQDSVLSKHIAPHLNEVGVLLPYSPLHVVLLTEFGGPLIATSANISGEPVLTHSYDVEQRLNHVANAYLHHNRRIQRPADDPVYRNIARKPRPLRLGRGNAPLELPLPFQLSQPVLAVGGHIKNTIALAWKNRIVVSPHIGDLESPRSQLVFEQVITDLQDLYHVRPEKIICDAHPDYGSSHWARQYGLPLQTVFHHHAHASAVAGEFPDEKRWLIFTWDGTGLSGDRSLWGGEALFGNSGHWQRVASMKPFFLPGADRAAREPWRSAAALCWENKIQWHPTKIHNYKLAYEAWQRNINSPKSTAAGRLFDAAAALIGLLDTASFEGQGPMYLEALARDGKGQPVSLPLVKDDDRVWRSDWSFLLHTLLDTSLSKQDRAYIFHQSMAYVILHQALEIRAAHGDFAVGLSGGVFQNKLLAEMAIDLLARHRFRYYLPETIPVNDAGLSFGQVVEYYGIHLKGNKKNYNEKPLTTQRITTQASVKHTPSSHKPVTKARAAKTGALRQTINKK